MPRRTYTPEELTVQRQAKAEYDRQYRQTHPFGLGIFIQPRHGRFKRFLASYQ